MTLLIPFGLFTQANNVGTSKNLDGFTSSVLQSTGIIVPGLGEVLV